MLVGVDSVALFTVKNGLNKGETALFSIILQILLSVNQNVLNKHLT